LARSTFAKDGETGRAGTSMFFFLPLYDDNPTGRIPYVTYGLIGLCGLVF
jgi:hypothetical protein